MLRFYKDDLENYLSRGGWLDLDSLDMLLLDYLKPHSLDHFTPLFGMFLFHVKSLQSLSCLDHVLVRDGVMPLVKFFWDYPEPDDYYKNLLLHESCSFLVPKVWRNRTMYYRDYSTLVEDNRWNKLFLTGIPNKDCVDIQKTMTKLKNALEDKEISEVYCCLFDNKWRDEGEVRQESGHYFELVKQLSIHFGSKLKFIQWETFEGMRFEEFYYFDLCTYPFYYSDSYVKHKVLSTGGKLLDSNRPSHFDSEEVVHVEALSPYHGYEILYGESEKDKAIQEEIQTKLKYVKALVGEEENLLSRRQGRRMKRTPGDHLCTKELKDFSKSLCRDYLS